MRTASSGSSVKSSPASPPRSELATSCSASAYSSEGVRPSAVAMSLFRPKKMRLDRSVARTDLSAVLRLLGFGDGRWVGCRGGDLEDGGWMGGLRRGTWARLGGVSELSHPPTHCSRLRGCDGAILGLAAPFWAWQINVRARAGGALRREGERRRELAHHLIPQLTHSTHVHSPIGCCSRPLSLTHTCLSL